MKYASGRIFDSYTTSYKISNSQYLFISKLHQENYIVSFAEFFRFCLMIFLHDKRNDESYVPQWFSDYKNFENKKAKNVSFKMLTKIRDKMDLFVLKMNTKFPNKKFTRSDLLRDSIDFAVSYFVTLDEIGVLMG
ncbi:hypothetical protein LCGC14_1267810 [marine sediment metagenome]|uniref:Uncharacterized protein n=1 Tax=marine sediment metagenome TaxID=412755 RepID=A0A0F9NFP0_9ZZZZ